MGRSGGYAAGGARGERGETVSVAMNDVTITVCANSMACGLPTTGTAVGSRPTPAAQTTQALLPARVDAPESSGWLWRSGSAAKRSATSTIHGESRRSICSVNSYHEIDRSLLIF